ncbi:MAG: hypothetical protein ABI643_03795 [Candidatus Doudnabacteria bacterium]
MDPKRKRLYIILIIACILISVGVFLWGRGGTSSPSAVTGVNNSPAVPTANLPSGSSGAPALLADGTYSAPPVFPASIVLDTTVLNSGKFKLLQPYVPVVLVNGDLGRDDPFKSY